MILALLLSVLPGIPVFGQSIVQQEFCGVNNALDTAVLKDCQAQDALNMEASKYGNSLKKRGGTSLFMTLSQAGAVNSAFGWKNAAGNEVLLFNAGGTIYASTNQQAAVQITTFTSTARMDCAESDGTAYCFSSANNSDFAFSYTGSVFKQLNTANGIAAGYPNGKFSVMTVDRHLVSGTTDFANRIYASQSGSVTSFNTGNLPSSAFTQDIATAGDQITCLRYLNGRVIVCKEMSISGINLTDQFNATVYDISKDVGLPPGGNETIIQRNGIMYFRGNDNHFYAIDGSPGGIEKLSVEISSTVASFLSGKTRYDIETSQADWQAGKLTYAGPQSPISAISSPGSIEPSSATFLDTTQTDFNKATLPTTLTTVTSSGSVQLSTAPFRIYNGDAETGDLTYWTCTKASGNDTCAVNTSGKISGTYGFQVKCSPCVGGGDGIVRLKDINGAVLLTQNYGGGTAVATSRTIDLSALGLSTQSIKIEFEHYCGSGGGQSILLSSTFTAVSSITYSASAGGCQNFGFETLDDIKVNRYFAIEQSSAVVSYVSQQFDTAFSTPIGGTFTVSSTTPAGTSLAYQVRSSSSPSGVFTAWANITNLDRITQVNRYYQYLSSFTTLVGTATPSVQDVTLIAATTGQYVTQCIQPASGITSYGNFEAAGSYACGGVTFYSSTGTACGSVDGPWTVRSTGTTLGAATTQALKYRLDFSINSATCTARIDSLTTNWLEGLAAVPYGAYWNDGLYWTHSTTGTTNNGVLKYDLLHKSWWPFDLSVNALLNYNNILYMGDTNATGKVFKYSNINQGDEPNSDNGAAINAYWRSKSFAPQDPFTEASWDRISVIARKQAGGTATMTWSINGGDTNSGNYSISLSTGPNAVRNNYSVPVGQRGTFFDYKISNNSVFPFEILGIKIDYKPFPWRPLP